MELLSAAQIRRTRYLDVVVDVPPSMEGNDGDADPASLQVLERLAKICVTHPGQVPARLHLQMPGGYKVVVQSSDDKRVMPSDDLISALERVKGVIHVTRT